MPLVRRTPEQERWENRLRREGLRTFDLEYVRGEGVERHVRSVHSEVITQKAIYLLEPQRLRDALVAWLSGDDEHFTEAGLRILRKPGRGRQRGPRWPRMRAMRLLKILHALCEGRTVNEAHTKRSERDLAYDYLRPLAAQLAQQSTPGDDDTSGDDGHRSD